MQFFNKDYSLALVNSAVANSNVKNLIYYEKAPVLYCTSVSI